MNIDRIRKRSLRYAYGQEGTYSDTPLAKITVEWLASSLHTRVAKQVKRLRLKRLGVRYSDYIGMLHWKEFRKSYISQRGHGCEVHTCKGIGTILHHRTYASLGYESFTEVFLVCKHHHDAIHDLVRRRSGIRTRQPRKERWTELPSIHQPWGGLFKSHSSDKTKSFAHLVQMRPVASGCAPVSRK